jgi:hypothetical protein
LSALVDTISAHIRDSRGNLHGLREAVTLSNLHRPPVGAYFSVPESFFARSAPNERDLSDTDRPDQTSPAEQSVLSIKSHSQICQSS